MGQHRVHRRAVVLQPPEEMGRVPETVWAVSAWLHVLRVAFALPYQLLRQHQAFLQAKPAGTAGHIHLPQPAQAPGQQGDEHAGAFHVMPVAGHDARQPGHEQKGTAVFHTAVKNLRHRQPVLEPGHHLDLTGSGWIGRGGFQHHVVKHQHARAGKAGGVWGIGLFADDLPDGGRNRAQDMHFRQSPNVACRSMAAAESRVSARGAGASPPGRAKRVRQARLFSTTVYHNPRKRQTTPRKFLGIHSFLPLLLRIAGESATI